MSLKSRRIIGQRLPKIIDPIRFARCHDVVVNGFYFRTGASFVAFQLDQEVAILARKENYDFSSFGLAVKIFPNEA